MLIIANLFVQTPKHRWVQHRKLNLPCLPVAATKKEKENTNKGKGFIL